MRKRTRAFPRAAENAEGYFLTRATMEWFCGHYLADKSHGTDWRVSPLRAKNLAGLAPAIVATAWFDPLRDEGKAYADALKAAGVPTSYYDGLGLIHGYFGLGEASETAQARSTARAGGVQGAAGQGRISASPSGQAAGSRAAAREAGCKSVRANTPTNMGDGTMRDG